MGSEDSEDSRDSSIWSQMPTPEISTAAAVPVARTDAAKQVQIQRVRDSITEMSNILSEIRAMREQQWSPNSHDNVVQSSAGDETEYLDAYEQPSDIVDFDHPVRNRAASYASPSSRSSHVERRQRQSSSGVPVSGLEKPFSPRASAEFERKFVNSAPSNPGPSNMMGYPPLPLSGPPPFISPLAQGPQPGPTSKPTRKRESSQSNVKLKFPEQSNLQVDIENPVDVSKERSTAPEQEPRGDTQKPKQKHKHRRSYRQGHGRSASQKQELATEPELSYSDKTNERRRRTFAKKSIESLLAHNPGYELEEIDLPAPERRLMDKFIDSLSKLSIEVQMDEAKRAEGLRRLNNALRALEGWI